MFRMHPCGVRVPRAAAKRWHDMKAFASFLVAVQFLTRFPVPSPGAVSSATAGRSLLYYPVVGLALGAVLAAVNAVLADTPSLLRAAIILATWIVLTGALHLDGLADSADAWVGGIGDRKRTLAIMKDPYCGPAAVVALIVVLLLKAAALHEIDTDDWIALVAVPVLARSSVLSLFLTTPYVRPGGLGAALSKQQQPMPSIVVLAVVVTVTASLAGVTGLWIMAAAVLAFIVLRAMMQHRIGGTTGDTAGALIELSETAMLVTLALRQG
jgi:adenosylcobinamide-GDP ribazoletransferase